MVVVLYIPRPIFAIFPSIMCMLAAGIVFYHCDDCRHRGFRRPWHHVVVFVVVVDVAGVVVVAHGIHDGDGGGGCRVVIVIDM